MTDAAAVDALLDRYGEEQRRREYLEGELADLHALAWELLLALPFDRIGSQAREAAEKLGRRLPYREEP